MSTQDESVERRGIDCAGKLRERDCRGTKQRIQGVSSLAGLNGISPHTLLGERGGERREIERGPLRHDGGADLQLNTRGLDQRQALPCRLAGLRNARNGRIASGNA